MGEVFRGLDKAVERRKSNLMQFLHVTKLKLSDTELHGSWASRNQI